MLVFFNFFWTQMSKSQEEKKSKSQKEKKSKSQKEKKRFQKHDPLRSDSCKIIIAVHFFIRN